MDDQEDNTPSNLQAVKKHSLKINSKKKTVKKGTKFIHGNYNRYYGYRNKLDNGTEDVRLLSFKREWFYGKDVLDIGCNIGHVTMTIAKQFLPRRIVGLDIDGNLISTARKNIRHYIDTKKEKSSDQSKCKGEVSATSNHGKVEAGDNKVEAVFPENVYFKQGNYVLSNPEHLDLVRGEYDVIIALSITKWVHLNNGDAGIKLFFQRIFRHLRPGGILILEPQPWNSYKRRKNLTLTIQNNYKTIKFRPEHFKEYLLGDVGFSHYELIDVIHHKSKGFRRPIEMYTKSESDSVMRKQDLDSKTD